MRVVYRISLWHGTARETGIVIPCWVYSCYTLYTGRWNGYNPDEHITIVDEYNKLELAKRQLKADKLQQELLSGQLSEDTVRKVCLHVCVCVCVCLWFTSLLLQDGDSDDSDHDEDKYADLRLICLEQRMTLKLEQQSETCVFVKTQVPLPTWDPNSAWAIPILTLIYSSEIMSRLISL